MYCIPYGLLKREDEPKGGGVCSFLRCYRDFDEIWRRRRKKLDWTDKAATCGSFRPRPVFYHFFFFLLLWFGGQEDKKKSGIILWKSLWGSIFCWRKMSNCFLITFTGKCLSADWAGRRAPKVYANTLASLAMWRKSWSWKTRQLADQGTKSWANSEQIRDEPFDRCKC